MFSHEERIKVIRLFLKYDCSYAAAIPKLGYPAVVALRQWCEDLTPGARKLRKSAVKLNQDQKEDVLRKFYEPQTDRKNLAKAEGISKVSLYQWKNTYLERIFHSA